MGIVEGSCGYRDHGVSIRDKLVLSRNLGYEGSRHVAKRSSEAPKQRYVTGEPGKFQGQDGVGIVEGFFGYRARGVSIRGNRETCGTRRIATCLNVVLTLQQVYATGEPRKVQGQDLVWIVVGSCG